MGVAVTAGARVDGFAEFGEFRITDHVVVAGLEVKEVHDAVLKFGSVFWRWGLEVWQGMT